MKSKFYCVALLISLLALSACGSKDLTVESEPERVVTNPLTDLVLLPHRFTEGLNRFLKSIPLRKPDNNQ